MVAVIADHLVGRPAGGFVGVDVFFVISGFLITGLLLREYEISRSISFTRFYVRRIKRILPAASFVLLATVCVSFALVGSVRFVDLCKDAVASSAFLANWRFAQKGTDYFQQELAASPLQHYWSLAVEEQFYLAWPWVLLGLLVVAHRRVGWRHEHLRLVAGVAIGVISAASFGWAVIETGSHPTWAYFSTASRAWELGAGALVAIAAPWLAVGSAAVRSVLSWLGLAGIVVSAAVVSEGQGFPAPMALVPVASTALVLAAGIGGAVGNPLLTNGIARYVGEISYSLYLWHFPVAVLLLTALAKGSWAYSVAGIVLTFVLSALTFRYLEQPARRAAWFHPPGARRLPRPARGWQHAATATAAILCLGVAGAVGVRALAAPPAQAAPVVLAGSTQARPADCFGAAALDPAHRCDQLNAGPSLAPYGPDAPFDTEGAYDCYAAAGEPLETCAYGSRDADALRVALVGDSHAAAMLPMVRAQLEDANWRVETFVGNGCRWYVPEDPETARCGPNLVQIQHALSSGRFDLVVAGASRGVAATTAADHVGAIEQVVAAGTAVVVVADNPDPSPDAVDCVTRIAFKATDPCGTPVEVALRAADPLAEAARQVPGAEVVDLTGFYCVEESCPSVIGNVVVYRDTAGHVTATWARTLGPYLVQEIQRVLESRSVG